MPDIEHRFLIGAPAEDIAVALVDEGAIAQWWSREVRVEGGTTIVSWSGHGWEVALDIGREGPRWPVIWRCVRSNMQNTDAWVGTTMTFDLADVAGGAELVFVQSGYRASPCHDVCRDGWAFFLGRSLKQFVETGVGIPYPDIEDTREEMPQ